MMDRIDGSAIALDQREAFRADVVEGLSARRRTLPSGWLYDDLGSALFERITGVDEYYPTRTETAILSRNAAEIASILGAGAVLIEYGAGAGIKTELVLSALEAPSAYVPVDIAGEFLERSAERLRARFPKVAIRPVVADFTADFYLPADLPHGDRSAFFPGSTIGNLAPGEAAAFLARVHRHVGAGGHLVIGLDLRKDVRTLLAAYDDREGVTAAFNLNMLTRINRELGGTFDLARFRHEARWNADDSAVESHIVCVEACEVSLDGRSFAFEEGESIHTESSRKYDLGEFAAFAGKAGFVVERIWQDPARAFAVVALRAEPFHLPGNSSQG